MVPILLIGLSFIVNMLFDLQVGLFLHLSVALMVELSLGVDKRPSLLLHRGFLVCVMLGDFSERDYVIPLALPL